MVLEATNFFIMRYSLPEFIDEVVLTIAGFGLISLIVRSWFDSREATRDTTKIELILQSIIAFICFFTVFQVIKNPGQASTIIHAGDVKSIAVLPFKNSGDNENFDYFGDGFADDVIARLSQSGEFRVISPASSFRHREEEIDIKKISKELGVNNILQGNYFIQNHDVRINVKLINAQNNEILVARTFNGILEDMLSLQSEVANGISGALRVKLLSGFSSAAEKPRNINIEAYENYQKGKSLFRKEYLSPNVFELSKEFFIKAISLDSMYADAYIGLAEASYTKMLWGFASFPEIASELKSYATIACRIKPEAGEPYGILGFIALNEYEWEEARNLLEKSISLNPNYPLSVYNYGLYFILMANKEKAYEQLSRCITLDPLNNNYKILMTAARFQFNDNDESIEMATKILQNEPSHDEALFFIGINYASMGLYEQALETFLKRAHGAKTNFALGYTYAKTGQKQKAEEILNNLLIRSKEGFVPPTQIALVYIGLGNYSSALDFLEKAYIENDGWLLQWTRHCNLYEPVRTDPRYKALLRIMKVG